MQNVTDALKPIFTPNAYVPHAERRILFWAWVAFALLVWQFVDFRLFPKPMATITAANTLRLNGTFLDYGATLLTMLESVLWSIVISLSLAYLSVVTFFKPAIKFLSGLRRFGLVGLLLLFTIIAPSGHALKVMLLTFAISAFYLRDMLSVVQAIPQEQYDHAKTLGMSNFRMIYEVVILGTLAEALESLRVNAAMGWMMLTSVEVVARSEGGIGIDLYNMNRTGDLPAVAAILISLYVMGAFQDWVIGAVKDYILCPYARLGKERN